MNERFALSDEDRQTQLWKRLSKHLEQRLALLRAQNDAPLPAEATAAHRGRIAEIKALLALDEPTAGPPRSDES